MIAPGAPPGPLSGLDGAPGAITPYSSARTAAATSFAASSGTK